MARFPITKTGRLRNSRRKYRKKTTRKKYNKKTIKRPLKLTRFVGIRKKLDNRPELKYTTMQINATSPGAAGTYMMFSLNRPRVASSFQHYTVPGSGLGEQNMVGSMINALSMDLRFSIAWNQTKVAASTKQQTVFRIMCVRSKLNNLVNSTTQPAMPQTPNEPIDNKDWHVELDRVYWLRTGYYAGINPMVQDKNLNFKFKIPCRSTIEKSTDVNTSQTFQWKQDFQIWIFMADDLFDIVHYYCKFYYRDP